MRILTHSLLVWLAGCGSATRPHAPAHAHGAVHFANSCNSTVQSDLDLGVTLLHHMTYTQARDAFRKATERDPSCAIAFWGVAMTLFTPLWPTRPSPEELATGWQAVLAARKAGPTLPRERGFVEATAAFFEEPESPDYWRRVDRWEAAMKTVHDANPDDVEATAFYALALLATARPGPTMREHSDRAIALLVPMYERHREHPGLMHYIIHANDVPGREHENLDIVRRYEQNAPDNPHAQHMPTHIYTRLGDWDGVIRGNLRAADAALRYPTGSHDELVWDEFPHAIEYLVYGYLQQGADAKAASQIDRLLAIKNLQPSAKTAFHLASTRARYTLERHAWHEAEAIVPREPALIEWDKFPWPEAVMWFAHGFGAVRAGNASEVPRVLERLTRLEAQATASGEAVFARQIQMLSLMLDGWNAHVARDDAKAVELLQKAIDLEGSTPKPPVTPASTLPAPEVLGDLLLELGRADEAIGAYRLSLQRFPRRFNSTLGLARALASKGDTKAASTAYCDLIALGTSGTRIAKLDDVQQASASCAHSVGR